MARKQLVKRIEKARREERKKELQEEKKEAEAEAKKEGKEEEPEEMEEAEGEEKEEGAEEKKAKAKKEGEEEKPEPVKELELPEYSAHPKPKLPNNVKKALRYRAEKKAVQPFFIRQEARRYKRLGLKWRRPKGVHSKLRQHWGYRINVVSIGFRGPKDARGLHPSGFREVLVHNVKELDAVDPQVQAIRIARTVGSKKRTAIEERIKELEKKKEVKYYLLNPLKTYDLVTVYQPSDLEAMDRGAQAAYISPSVGKQMKKAIIAKAKEMGGSGKGKVTILNARKELAEEN
jgi:large subunit ribosomal protein L32e